MQLYMSKLIEAFVIILSTILYMSSCVTIFINLCPEKYKTIQTFFRNASRAILYIYLLVKKSEVFGN